MNKPFIRKGKKRHLDGGDAVGKTNCKLGKTDCGKACAEFLRDALRTEANVCAFGGTKRSADVR